MGQHEIERKGELQQLNDCIIIYFLRRRDSMLLCLVLSSLLQPYFLVTSYKFEGCDFCLCFFYASQRTHYIIMDRNVLLAHAQWMCSRQPFLFGLEKQCVCRV